MYEVGPPSTKNRFSASTASADAANTHFVHSTRSCNNLRPKNSPNGNARMPMRHGTCHAAAPCTRLYGVPFTPYTSGTGTSEPRNPRRGGRNLEPRNGFKKEIGAPMARPLDLEPGTYRNLFAEGSRNQNRGTPWKPRCASGRNVINYTVMHRSTASRRSRAAMAATTG